MELCGQLLGPALGSSKLELQWYNAFSVYDSQRFLSLRRMPPSILAIELSYLNWATLIEPLELLRKVTREKVQLQTMEKKM